MWFHGCFRIINQGPHALCQTGLSGCGKQPVTVCVCTQRLSSDPTNSLPSPATPQNWLYSHIPSVRDLVAVSAAHPPHWQNTGGGQGAHYSERQTAQTNKTWHRERLQYWGNNSFILLRVRLVLLLNLISIVTRVASKVWGLILGLHVFFCSPHPKKVSKNEFL